MKNIFLFFTICSCGITSQEKSTNENITIKIGEKFDVRLDAALGTGFSWSLLDSSYSKYLSLDTTFVIPNQSGKDGAQETQIFQFKGLTKGNTNLHFMYSRPWQKNEKTDKKRDYSILVQ